MSTILINQWLAKNLSKYNPAFFNKMGKQIGPFRGPFVKLSQTAATFHILREKSSEWSTAETTYSSNQSNEIFQWYYAVSRGVVLNGTVLFMV